MHAAADAVKLARLAVDGGVEIGVDLLVRAANLTYHNGDHVLCERIGRKAFEMSGRFDAGWELANCLFQAGDLHGFREHLPLWGATATNDAERLAVAMMQAQASSGTPATSREPSRSCTTPWPPTRRTCSPPAPPTTETGREPRALSHALAGNPQLTWELSEPLLSHGPDPVLIRRAGGGEHARPHGQGGAGDGRHPPRWRRTTSSAPRPRTCRGHRVAYVVRAVGHTWRGVLPMAWDDHRAALATAISEFQISSANYVARGPAPAAGAADPGEAADGSFAGVVRPLDRREQRASLGARPHGRGVCQRRRSGGGRAAGALRVRRGQQPRGVVRLRRRDRARTPPGGEGQPGSHAGDAALDDGVTAADAGQVVPEIWVAYELVRLDRAKEVVERLEALVAASEGTLSPALAAHARGLADHDVTALDAAAAAALAELGPAPLRLRGRRPRRRRSEAGGQTSSPGDTAAATRRRTTRSLRRGRPRQRRSSTPAR